MFGQYGMVFPYEVLPAQYEDVSAVAFAWDWVNRAPIFTRSQKIPASRVDFQILTSPQRPETVTMAAAALVGDTTLSVSDATYIMNGDTLEWQAAGGIEVLEVVGDPVTSTTPNTITVVRGDAFSTAYAITNGAKLRLLGNSRTGGEINQHGISAAPTRNTGWIQTMDHPVEVAGVLQDTTAFAADVIAAGAATPLDAYRMKALENLIFDAERSMVYQVGEAPTDTNTKRAKMKGLRQQISAGGTLITAPVNGGAYTPSDFVRDVSVGPAAFGAQPDLFLISTDWVGGLARWKLGLSRVDNQEFTKLNVAINTYESTAAPEATFVIAPKLKSGTLIALRERDLICRYMRLPTWKPRGSQGDAEMGDMIARVGAQLNHPYAAVMIENVTGFANP